MSEPKFTKGPWRVVLSNNATPHVVHENGEDSTDLGDRSSLVCAMPAEIMASYNAFANAHLIAAAPDLYEALAAFERVQELWLPIEVAEEHAGEAEALHAMRWNMLAALAKARV